VQMLDVNFPTTDGRTLVMRRYTELGPSKSSWSSNSSSICRRNAESADQGGGKRREGIAGWRSYRCWPAPRAIKERAWLDRAGAAAEGLLLPRIGSLKPASVSFLKRFLENLPITYPELF
jgi:hypothetical protein